MQLRMANLAADAHHDHRGAPLSALGSMRMQGRPRARPGRRPPPRPRQGWRSKSQLAARCPAAPVASAASWLVAAAPASARTSTEETVRFDEWCRHDLPRRLGADLAPVAPSEPLAHLSSEWAAAHRARRAGPSADRRRHDLARQGVDERPTGCAEQSHEMFVGVSLDPRTRGRLFAAPHGERHDAQFNRFCLQRNHSTSSALDLNKALDKYLVHSRLDPDAARDPPGTPGALLAPILASICRSTELSIYLSVESFVYLSV